MKLNRVLFILAAIILTILTIKAQNKTPSYNFSRALEEAQKGNKQSAMEYFNKEVSDNPKNGYAYMAIASFHMDNLEYGDARNAVESAIKYLPRKDKSSLSRIYLLRGQLLAIEEDTIGAYSDIATAIQLAPTNEDA